MPERTVSFNSFFGVDKKGSWCQEGTDWEEREFLGSGRPWETGSWLLKMSIASSRSLRMSPYMAKTDFVDVTKLKAWDKEVILDYLGGLSANHILPKREAGGSVTNKALGWRGSALKIEERARTKECGWLLETGKARGQFVPRSLCTEPAADMLTGAQWNWFQTSGLRNCKNIHACCFKPLDLFIIAPIENEDNCAADIAGGRLRGLSSGGVVWGRGIGFRFLHLRFQWG